MYRFRLQRVLEYRRRREDDRQQALRQAQLLQSQEETRLEALRQEARAQEEALAATAGTGLPSADWILGQQHYRSLIQGAEAQQDIVAQMAQRVAEHRQQLLVARQETKVIEKLNEKAKQRYLAEMAKRDNELLDELALTRSRHER